MSEQFARIETMLTNVIKTSASNSNKLDSIIERNAKTDTQLALLKQSVESHNKEDDIRFSDINKKHSGYDKFIRGILVFAVAELIGVLGAILLK